MGSMHHMPPPAPPADTGFYQTSYNSYAKPSPSSTSITGSPGAPPPRLSSHPFFIDQTPYLSSSRSLSEVSLLSTSSASTGRTSRSVSGSSASSTASSAAASSLSLAPSWPFRNTGRPCQLAPAAPITSSPDHRSRATRPRHSRAASTGHASTTPPSAAATAAAALSPKASSLHTPTAPIDRRCLQWMREAEQQEWILGSVASRVSPRGVRREAISDTDAPAGGHVEILYEHEREDADEPPPRPGSAASKCSVSSVKRRFRLNSA